jgi:electron transfer flavoprotein beta subunit
MSINILACIKRVPDTGARIVLTQDEQEIETRALGFAISPHEECAVEEAIRLVEEQGGSTVVLTLGPAAAAEQLLGALAQGVQDAVLLETDGRDWDPQATARAIVTAVQTLQQQGRQFDLLLFGNESADSGGYQVGIRVAHALDWPCVTGVKGLAVKEGVVTARRPVAGGWEVYELPLPAVVTVKEGINSPRYPTLRGRMAAKKKEIQRFQPQAVTGGLQKVRLRNLKEKGNQVQLLGSGVAAVPRIVDLLQELGFVKAK